MFTRTKKKGFTLLELIVVIVILGILAALAIPSFSNVKTKAAEKTAISSAEGIVRDARAIAAFDGAPLSDFYVDRAGSETSVYNATGDTVTITSNGNTATATIDPITGNVTVSGGNGGGASLGTAASLLAEAGLTPTGSLSTSDHYLSISTQYGFAGYWSVISGASGLQFGSLADINATIANTDPDNWMGPYAAETYDLSQASQGHIVATYAGGVSHWYNIDANGNVIPF